MDTLVKFLKDVSQHKLEVLKNDGLYRHLKMSKPGSSNYRYEVITVPNYLFFVGDMGSWTFSRHLDNFMLFRMRKDDFNYSPNEALSINPGYWAEKLQAFDKTGLKVYSEHRLREHIQEVYKEWVEENSPTKEQIEEVNENLEDVYSCDNEYEVRRALDNFTEIHGFEFHDTWEWDLTEYSYHYVWACCAIVYAIQEFDKLQGMKDG